MSRSSRRRAQAEPVVALVALVVVGAAISMYAGVLGSLSFGTDRNTAEIAIERVRATVEANGVILPGALDTATTATPDGFRMNVTLSTDTDAYSVGPSAPIDVESATRFVPVRTAPDRVRPGTLTVNVWR